MYLSESLVVEAVWVFFLLGVGILHSIWKATQLVQGMPKEAASQRTFLLFNKHCQSVVLGLANAWKHWYCRPRMVRGEGGRAGLSRSYLELGIWTSAVGGLGSLFQGRFVDDGIDVRMTSLYWQNCQLATHSDDKSRTKRHGNGVLVSRARGAAPRQPAEVGYRQSYRGMQNSPPEPRSCNVIGRLANEWAERTRRGISQTRQN